MTVFHRLVLPIAPLLLTAALAAAGELTAVTSGGSGDLTMCSYRGCNLYHHIDMPARIAVGDTVRLRYGSNPKLYDFPVARIVSDGGACTVYSETDDTSDVNKIELSSCKTAPAAQ